MKVLLLNAGPYCGLQDVEFPVGVEGEYWSKSLIDVFKPELVRVGADPRSFQEGMGCAFEVGTEVEVIK